MRVGVWASLSPGTWLVWGLGFGVWDLGFGHLYLLAHGWFGIWGLGFGHLYPPAYD